MPKVSTDTVVFPCGYCHTRVQAKILGSVPDRYAPHEPPAEWVLTKCSNCDKPNVVGREYLGSHNDEEIWDEWRIFPPRDRTFGNEVPDPIRRSFAEVQTNVRSGSLLSAALMCRRTVELLAKDQGVRHGDLATKLEALREKGVIDSRLYEWADALRLAGNDAAHEDDPDLEISKEDAEDLRVFTEAIIDYVYIYRARFEEFRSRRPVRAAPVKRGQTGTADKNTAGRARTPLSNDER